MENTDELRKDRIEIIDILRGFALLGIVIVHFNEQYYGGQLPVSQLTFGEKNMADRIVNVFSGIFFQGKFYMIFSFLFGWSFFIQLDKRGGSPSSLLRFSWRLMVLLGIGFLHRLHYRGDILSIYALLGFVLLFFNWLPDKVLLVLALILVFNIPSMGVRLYEAGFGSAGNPFRSSHQRQLQQYFDVLKSGSYFNILNANLHEFGSKLNFQVDSGRIYIRPGLFLLGIYAGRKKFFENWENQIAWTKKLGKVVLWTTLGCLAFLSAFGGIALTRIKISNALGLAIGGLAYDVFNACLATLYVVGILLLFRSEKWKPRLMQLCALGRMGLSTYLMQTLFGFFIFFSVGFDLLGTIGALPCLLMAVAVYGFQIYFSQWWMKNFHYGPVEWLWRSLTYFKIQPMMK